MYNRTNECSRRAPEAFRQGTLPHPPELIINKKSGAELRGIAFLGQGGFGRVFEVENASGARIALKIIPTNPGKARQTRRAIDKEINNHKLTSHPNIVKFMDHFQDNQNVYLALELCTSGSLADMVKRRGRLSEPEVRFFMVQVVGGCHYMHSNQIIHRDIKLGNFLLDKDMNIKIGDFGCSTRLKIPGQRKHSILATPNYISPEVLDGAYSYEADIWAIGVCFYTLVVGQPPFQCSNTKKIYKRVLDIDYEFPKENPVSPSIRNLIERILTRHPSDRPNVHDIVSHDFFTEGPVPSHIPEYAINFGPPEFGEITKEESDANLARLKKKCLLDVDPDFSRTLGVFKDCTDLLTTTNISSLRSFALPRHSASSMRLPGVALSLAQRRRDYTAAPVAPSLPLLPPSRRVMCVGSETLHAANLARRITPSARTTYVCIFSEGQVQSVPPSTGRTVDHVEDISGVQVQE